MLTLDQSQTAPSVPQIAAYKLGQKYTFGILAQKNGVEDCFRIQAESDRFCNVCAAFNKLHPGWAILESWEIVGLKAA